MNYFNQSILTAFFLLIGFSDSFGQISLNSNTNTAEDVCDAFSYKPNVSQDGYPYETHGIPTAPQPNGSTNLTTLECDGSSGSQGLAVEYSFQAGHTYSVSITGRTMSGSPTMVVKVSNIDFASNDGCEEIYGEIPEDDGTIYYWNGMLPFNASNANAVTMHDPQGNTSVKMDADYSKLWIYLDNTTGAGELGLSSVTITDMAVISTTGTGTPEPIHCTSADGQICSANASIYYNVKPGTAPAYTAIGGSDLAAAYLLCEEHAPDEPNTNNTFVTAVQNYYIVKRNITGVDTSAAYLPGMPIAIDRSITYTTNSQILASPGTQVNQLSSGTLRSLLTKSAGTLVDVYAVYKDLVGHYCTDNVLFYHGGCGDHTVSTSNAVTIQLCSFDNPLAVTNNGVRLYPRKITTDSDFSKCVAHAINIKLTEGQKQADGTYIDDYSYIIWDVPNGWTINPYYGKVSPSKTTTVVQGQSLIGIQAYPYTTSALDGIPLGVITAHITYADGQKEVVTFTIPSNAAQAPRLSLDSYDVAMCKNQGATINASPSNTSVYSYAWGGAATGVLNVVGGLNGPSLVLSAQQWNPYDQTVTITVINKASQCQASTYASVTQAGWADATPWGENATFYKNGDSHFYNNIVADKKGNVFYMGGDGGTNYNDAPRGVYTLQWDPVKSIWQNYSLPKGGTIFSTLPSTLGMTDDGTGVSTLYFLGADSKIHTNIIGTTTQTILQTPTTVAGAIYANRSSGYDDVIYTDHQNNLWHYTTNNAQSVLVASNVDNNASGIGQAISPIIIGGRVVYTKNNGQLYVNSTAIKDAGGNPVLAAQGTNYGSNLAPYDPGTGNYKVYFLLGNTTGALTDQIGQLDASTFVVRVLPHTGTGIDFLTVNQSTGVIYYNNEHMEVHQMFDDNNSHASNGNCIVPLWNATAAYHSGDEVLYNGIIYQANWWTQNNQPDKNVGVSGSGQPWASLGACINSVPLAPAWKDLLVSTNTSGSNGYMLFAYPNIWYNDEGSNLKFSFFNTSFCSPAVYREAATTDVAATANTEESTQMNVFPNPTAGNVTVSLFLTDATAATVSITNVEGIQVYEQTVNLEKGANAMDIATQNYTNGLYNIRVTDPTGKAYSLRLVVLK